jgi:hypothetical protein
MLAFVFEWISAWRAEEDAWLAEISLRAQEICPRADEARLRPRFFN